MYFKPITRFFHFIFRILTFTCVIENRVITVYINKTKNSKNPSFRILLSPWKLVDVIVAHDTTLFVTYSVLMSQ